MANKKPLVVGSTLPLEQIQSGDNLDLGNYQLPDAIGSAGQVLAVPAVGTELEWVNTDAGENTVSMTNGNAGTITICQAVYVSGAGEVDLARANAAATAVVFGLVADASVATTDPANIQFTNIFTATTGQWDAVTGGSGGLTPGSIYYLDPDTAGNLTTTKTSTVTEVIAAVGLALTTTTLQLRIDPAILL